MTQLLLYGEALLSSLPAWDEKPVISHPLSARTKITNKRIHLNVPKIDTVVY